MEALAYYADQSPITDPGGMVRHLATLPRDLAALRRVARGLVLHYRADDPSAHGILDDRLREIDSRYAETMLRRPVELDRRPLAEVWDADQARWRLVDPELGDNHVDPSDGAWVDPLDVPRDRFLVAGSAWQACRRAEADPETFLVDPGLDVEATRGWPYLRHNLVHDLAALNKVEMLLWDGWGLIEQVRPSAQDLELLDRVAEATLSSGDTAFGELRHLYAEPGLRVPRQVVSHSPASEAPRPVDVAASP